MIKKKRKKNMIKKKDDKKPCAAVNIKLYMKIIADAHLDHDDFMMVC